MTGTVVDPFSDGTHVAQLFALEATGYEDAFLVLSVVDSGPDMEPTDDSALVYTVAADGERVVEVHVQPDRARIEFFAYLDVITEVASRAGLRVRPKAVHPPRTLVSAGDDVQMKRTLPAFRTLIAALGAGGREEDEG